jgi:hypothetical protein
LPSAAVSLDITAAVTLSASSQQQRNLPFLKYFHNRDAYISLVGYKKDLTLPKKKKSTLYSTGVLTISLLHVTALLFYD